VQDRLNGFKRALREHKLQINPDYIQVGTSVTSALGARNSPEGIRLSRTINRETGRSGYASQK
jgi:DNA-binding LacI/PurR family transcriptional regulator